MTDNVGIAACMRLNAKLAASAGRMRMALERIAGRTECSGPMIEDEDGSLFPPDMAECMRKVHARACHRCIARAALAAEDTMRGSGDEL